MSYIQIDQVGRNTMTNHTSIMWHPPLLAHPGPARDAFHLAHSCTIFPCYLEIAQRVVTPYVGGVDYKQCSGGPNCPNRMKFLANITCQYRFLAGKQKNTNQKHFLGRKKGPFFLVFTNFRKWGLLAVSNPHFRKFASCRLPPSADRVPTMFTNFRK